MSGWIKLHRSLESWEWYSDPNTVVLFLSLLLRATHKPTRYRGMELIPGDVIYGHPSMAKRLGISIQSVRTSLNKLKSTGEITVKTTNKFSIVSITNWDKFQNDQQTDQQATNRQVTGKQQATNTIQECKEGKECKEAIEIYNHTASQIGIPVVQKITNTRRRKILARLNEIGGLEGWKVCVNKIRHSELLSGGKGNWSATLDWVIEPKNMTKIMEGNYDQKDPRANVSAKFDEARQFAERFSS